MTINPYFERGSTSEQDMYEDIIIESLQIYGQDVYYLPRDIVNIDTILGEDIPSRFNSSHRIEMYIENTQGFEGEGDLFTKFGIQIRDQATFIVARKRWTRLVLNRDNEISGNRPREGDLIWLPLSKSLFEITHVEHQQPFYQIKDLPTYKLHCELFEYSGEDFDTGIDDIDTIELTGYSQVLVMVDSDDGGDFIIGNTVTQLLPSGVTVTGEIAAYNDSDYSLTITQIGSDDTDENRFHLFLAGENIVIADDSDGFVRSISSVSENIGDVFGQNDDFSTSAYEIIDWTETNVFGEPDH